MKPHLVVVKVVFSVDWDGDRLNGSCASWCTIRVYSLD